MHTSYQLTRQHDMILNPNIIRNGNSMENVSMYTLCKCLHVIKI